MTNELFENSAHNVSRKSYFPEFLWISLDRIIVLETSIVPLFKGLGMRNLQY